MLAISTTWNQGRHGSLLEAVREIARMKFSAVELRCQGEARDAAAAATACRDFGVCCRSVHAPLTARPWSDGDPSRDLASTDEARRARAVAAVCETLPAAAAARAQVIVLHPGQIDVDDARERQRRWLREVVEGRPLPDDAARGLASRAENRDAHLLAAAKSLHDLKRAAPEVVWALETRLYFHEIPNPEEVELLVSDAGPAHAAYWHDTGHAHLQGRIGVADPLSWLDRHGSRTAGVHLHDVVGARDHLPPGVGEADWPGIRDYLSAGMLRVLEVHGSHGPRELVMGADFLRENGLA